MFWFLCIGLCIFRDIADHLNRSSICEKKDKLWLFDLKMQFSFIYTLAEFLHGLFGPDSNVFRLYLVMQHLWRLAQADRDLLVFRMQIGVCFLIRSSQHVYEQTQTPFILMILAACIQLHAMKYLAHFRSLLWFISLNPPPLLIGWKQWYPDILLWKINE